MIRGDVAFSLAFLAAGLLPAVPPVRADDAIAHFVQPARAVQPASAEEVVVRVRTIRATELVDGEEVEVTVDESIRDLSAKLRQLHFRNFQLVASERQRVPLLRKQNIALTEGQQLTVRPLYVAQKRTGMWLKWSDRNGGPILDTRMHFECGESMLTGTERAGDTGVILAIDVMPAPR